jgi:hypothetical protein
MLEAQREHRTADSDLREVLVQGLQQVTGVVESVTADDEAVHHARVDRCFHAQTTTNAVFSGACSNHLGGALQVTGMPVRAFAMMGVAPHHHGGVGRMLTALRKAGVGVGCIDPWTGKKGLYRLIVGESPELAATILEGVGCRMRAVAPAIAPSFAFVGNEVPYPPRTTWGDVND